MKTLKIIFLLIFTSILIYSCSDDSEVSDLSTSDRTEKRNSDRERLTQDCPIDNSLLSEEDQLKQLFAEFLDDAMQNDGFKRYLLSNLFNNNKNDDNIQNPEYLIAQHLSDNIEIGESIQFGTGPGTVTTFDDIFTTWLSINDPDQISIFQNLCSQYTDLVFHFPWWSVDIINHYGGVEEVDIAVIGAIEPVNCNGKEVRSLFYGGEENIINVNEPISTQIPIYVKNAESHIEVLSTPEETINEMVENLNAFYAGCTFSEDELLTFIETVDCSNLQFIEYSRMLQFFKGNCTGTRHHELDCCDGIDNDGDGLVDCDDVDDCPCNVEICGDGCDNNNDGHIDEDCPCEGQYQRDCVAENNLLTGVKMANSAWSWVCQTKEEDDIYLWMNFDGVRLCETSPCEIDQLQDFALFHDTNVFFEIQIFDDDIEDEDDIANVAWQNEDGDEYWKVFPLYVPVLGKEYLSSWQNQWIPSVIGSRISFSVTERDNQQIS